MRRRVREKIMCPDFWWGQDLGSAVAVSTKPSLWALGRDRIKEAEGSGPVAERWSRTEMDGWWGVGQNPSPACGRPWPEL